jgi:hypothetical protein
VSEEEMTLKGLSDLKGEKGGNGLKEGEDVIGKKDRPVHRIGFMEHIL